MDKWLRGESPMYGFVVCVGYLWGLQAELVSWYGAAQWGCSGGAALRWCLVGLAFVVVWVQAMFGFAEGTGDWPRTYGKAGRLPYYDV